MIHNRPMCLWREAQSSATAEEMKTTEASLHSKAACSASLCARVAATVAPTPHIAASAPPPPPPPRRLVHEKGKLPSLEVRHGTHYMETACGAKCKRVVQRELENTSVEQLLDGEKSKMYAFFLMKLKALLHTNVFNDITASPFLVSFSQLPAAEKKTENGEVPSYIFHLVLIRQLFWDSCVTLTNKLNVDSNVSLLELWCYISMRRASM